MSDDRAVFIGALTVVLLRLIDYALPKGRHWKFIDRLTAKDDPDRPAKPEDKDG